MLYNCHPIGLSDCGLHSACVQQYSYQHLLSLHPHKLQEWKVNWTILYCTLQNLKMLCIIIALTNLYGYFEDKNSFKVAPSTGGLPQDQSLLTPFQLPLPSLKTFYLLGRNTILPSVKQLCNSAETQTSVKNFRHL